MKNAGKYNKKICIYEVVEIEDSYGFKNKQKNIILKTYANIKTTKGFTLIANNSDFEKAYTKFTIRFPKKEINRHMLILFNNKLYSIEYINNVDEKNEELELQAKLVIK